MNYIIFFSGILYTILSLFIAVTFIFITIKFLKQIHKNIIQNVTVSIDNIAVSLYVSSSIFSVGWVMRDSIEPAITSFNLALRSPSTDIINYLIIFGIMILQIVVPGILSFGFIVIGLIIFQKMTKDINEMNEIINNNIALAILLSTIIIVLVLFIQPGIRMTMDGLIPFPKLGIRN